MHGKINVALICAIALTGCTGDRRPPAEAAPPASNVSPPASTAAPQVDPATAHAIGEALHELQTASPEPLSPQREALAKDSKALVGVWRIRQLLARTNGKGGPPSAPILFGTWEFKKNGDLLIRGGNAIDVHYTYTGERLLVSGFGPVQDYRVDRLTATELQVTAVIEAGTLKFENTTFLERTR